MGKVVREVRKVRDDDGRERGELVGLALGGRVPVGGGTRTPRAALSRRPRRWMGASEVLDGRFEHRRGAPRTGR